MPKTTDLSSYLDQLPGSQPGRTGSALSDYLDHLDNLPPAPEPEKPRTWGNVATDLGASALGGINDVAKLVTMGVDKVMTGNAYGPGTQALSDFGDAINEQKSPQLQAKEKAAQAKIADAEKAGREWGGEGWKGDVAGTVAGFGSGVYQTLKDPALLTNFAAQQLPNMALMHAGALGAGVTANAVAKAAPGIAATKYGVKAIENAGTGGAVLAAAVQQGASSGEEAFQRLMELPDADWMAKPEFVALANQIGADAAKQQLASQIAEGVAVKSGIASVGTAMLPGGTSVERVMAGKHAPMSLKGAATAMRGEFTQEGLEEGSGRLFGNLGVQQVNPNQAAMQGVGGAAGQGAAAGGVIGGGTHLYSGWRDKKSEPTQENQLPANTPDIGGSVGDGSGGTPPIAPIAPIAPPPSGPLGRAAALVTPPALIVQDAITPSLTGTDAQTLLAPQDNPLLEAARENKNQAATADTIAPAATESIATDASNQPRGPFASTQEASDYLSAQRRAASISLPPALPIEYPDNSHGVAVEGGPDFKEAQAQAHARRLLEAGVQEGDVLNPKGDVFKTKQSANKIAKQDGGEVTPVNGGFVVRKTSEKPHGPTDGVLPAPAISPQAGGADSAASVGTGAADDAGQTHRAPGAPAADVGKPGQPASGVADKAVSLPQDLAGAKPGYGFGAKKFTLNFANDIDKSAYIAAQATPSKRDADYLGHAMVATGMTEAEVRKHGQIVRAAIKEQAKNTPAGDLQIPSLYTPKPSQGNTDVVTPTQTLAPATGQPPQERGAERQVNSEQPAAAPVAENQALAVSDSGDGGVAPVQVDGGPIASDKQTAAINRIAKGTAYFGTQSKATEWMDKSDIGETHEVVKHASGANRWDVVAKGVQPAVETAPALQSGADDVTSQVDAAYRTAFGTKPMPAGLKVTMRKMAKAITERDPVVLADILNPDNKTSRKAFEYISGEKLPAGLGATQKAVQAWVKKPESAKPAQPADSFIKHGKTAFEQGQPRVLPGFFSAIESGDPAKEWYQGWDAANAAAPVRTMQTANAPAVSSLHTGQPDPKNTAPMQSLDGYTVGDTVDIPNRTFGKGKIETLYRRDMLGMSPGDMARIVREDGKKLDVLTSELKKVDASVTPVKEELSDSTKARNLLMELQAKQAANGQIGDDRLETQINQIKREIKAIEAEEKSNAQNDELDAEMRAYEDKATDKSVLPAAPDPIRDERGEAGGYTRAEKSLQAVAHASGMPGDIKLQSGQFVTEEQAVAAAREHMTPEQWAMPFQFNRVLDIPPLHWNQMVKAMAQKSEPVPDAKTALTEQEKAAKAKMLGAAAKLAALLSKNTRANITPEQEQAMLPIVIELFEGAMALGYIKFKQAARYVREYIANAIDQDAADSIPIDTLQGAYIATARRHADKDITPKKEVVAVDSIADLTEELENPAKLADTGVKEHGNATQQLDQPSPRPLEGAPAQDGRTPDSSRDTGAGTDGGRAGDIFGNEGTDNPGSDTGRGLGADAGAVPVPAGRAGADAKNAKKPRVSRPKRTDAGLGLFGAAGGIEPEGGHNPAPNAPAIAAPQPSAKDFTITDELALGEGGQKTKYRNNVAAIRLVNDLAGGGRLATLEEQATLAKYVGWGGIPQAFDPANADWSKEFAELSYLMGPTAFAEARQSTRYAHYTSKEIIVDGIYAAMRQFGFTGGKTLEAGAGVGNFIGMMPADMRSAGRFTAIEREPFSSAIARQLYPQQNVQRADFTEFKGNDAYFDAAVGNPPFASDPQTDRSGRKHLSGLSLHNYFFAKSIDMLREGGIMAQVVTNAFMDAKGDKARKYMSDRVEFLGAIRLPNSAFAKNANTEVTTDIVFLKKRPDSEVGGKAAQADAKRWLNIGSYTGVNGKAVALNQYFIDHPDMMLGNFGAYGSMYGPDQPALVAKPGQDTLALLKAAVGKLPSGIYKSIAETGTSDQVNAAIVALNNPSVREGGYFMAGDKLMQRLPDIAGEARGIETTAETQWTEKTKLGESGFERIKALASLRGTVRGLLAAEMSDDAAAMKALRTTLNQQYDAYRDTHGLINDPSTLRVFEDDPDFPLLASLEHGYTPGVGPAAAKRMGVKPTQSTAKKGPIFNQRVVAARTAVQKVDTPADALAVSMAERGKLDAAYIGQLLGMEPEAVLKALSTGDKPLLFRDPATDEYVLRDAYLSGNVRAKLAQAKSAGMFTNINELEAVQPEDVGSHEITARLGSPWVPTEVYRDFAESIFGEESKASVFYLKTNSSFQVTVYGSSDVALHNTWGTKEYPGDAMLQALMNNRSIKITYKDSDGKTHTDVDATEKANTKGQEVKEKFNDWLFSDPERSELLTKAYNETNNNYVTRVYEGSHMTFPGKVPDSVIKFRRHQRNAIARIVQDRTTLLDHVVGAGKTFTVISGAMELKRTGLARKPMVAVPNHLVKQWAADFYRLYPGANVLTATKKDFEKANRRKFLARIATGDWDAVVIAHSSFGFIKPAPEFEAEFNGREIAKIMETIQQVESDDGDKPTKKRTIKQLEGMKERLENRIRQLRDKPMDDLLDFEQIGVDQLFVDEAHMFKNLMYTTKMQGVAGLNDPAGSQRAYDMYVKTNQVMEKNGRGQGVVFATGTPVSNSLAEMYHMMRYLMPAQMKELGFESFDAWANTYASVEQVWMQAPSGDGFKATNRMSNFVNTTELLKMFDQVSDTVTMDDIKKAYSEENDGAEFPLPKLKGGRRTPVSLEKSAAQNAYMDEIAKRAKAIEKRKGPPKKGDDNILVVMGDARKAAMDIRLVRPDITTREPGGRIDRATDEAVARYKQYDKVKGTQIVFSDLGTPLKHAKKELVEYEALQARIQTGNADVEASATLGNETAMGIMEDAEAAQAELEAMGADWLGAVKAALRGFSIYDDFKAALIEKGIPEVEIAFIHDFNTDDQKATLFRKVNAGQIRFVLGSTSKLGAGTNVQERLVAEHHLDVPWRPSDVEQREGRIERQGNRLMTEVPNFEIEILAYVTRDTLDMRMWQVQETKLKMINQLRTRKIGREIDNAFEDMELSAGEMQAAATGDVNLLKEIQLRNDVKKLEQRRRSFDGQSNDLISRKRRNEEAMRDLPKKLRAAEIEAGFAAKYQSDRFDAKPPFKLNIDGKDYTDVSEAQDYLRKKTEAKSHTLDDVEYDQQQFDKLPEVLRLKIALLGTTKATPIAININGEVIKNRSTVAELFSDARGDIDPIAWTVGSETYYRRSVLANAMRQNVIDAIADETTQPVGKIGAYTVAVEGSSGKEGAAYLEVTLSRDGEVKLSNTLNVGETAGMPARVIAQAENLLESAVREADYLERTLARAKKDAADLDKTAVAGDWPDQAKLDAARAAHKDVLAQLKKKEDAAPEGNAAEANNGPVFSTTDSAPEKQLPLQQIERLVKSALRGMKNAPSIQVFANPAAAGLRVSDKVIASGVVLPTGEIYVFQSGVGSALDVDRVIFHELFHKGLQNVMAPADYVPTMLKLAAHDDRLQQYANDWKKTAGAADQLAGLKARGLKGSELQGRYDALAVEEGLAKVAEDIKADRQSGTQNTLVSKLANWLAKLADKLGMTRLANTIRAMSYNEAEKFVADTISQAGGKGAGETRFRTQGGVARGKNDAMTNKDVVGNNGNFDGTNPDIRFSQRSISSLTNHIADKLGETLSHPGKLSWYDKSLSTMYHLAERHPPFKRVFNAAQDFINDVSYFATEAADMAPKILPKLDTWADMLKTPVSAADNKAIAAPIFEGTLSWTRDAGGKPVKASNDDKPGLVWTAAELKSIFALTPAQVGLYQEFRAATDASLDNMAKADLLRLAGKDAAHLKAMVMDAATVDDAAILLRDDLLAQATDDPARSAALTETANSMMERADKITKLKAKGYAPLSRFGRFTVDVVVDGQREYFSLFESARAANQAAAKLKMEFGPGNVNQGTLSQREFEAFQGITPESLELFGNMLGLDSTGDQAQDKVFQEYIKLTKNNRSAMKRLMHRKGIAGYSEDVGRVLAAFVYSNARQTSAALHMGTLGESIQDIPKAQGELKDVALELSSYIKQPREEAQALRGVLFAQYLGGSVASAMVNLTQPLTVSLPYLSQYGGAVKAGAALVQAMKDQRHGVKLEAGLERAIKVAQEQGVVAPQEVHQLMAQARGAASLNSGDGTRVGDAQAFAGNQFTKLALGWGKLFGLAEQINRRSTFIAAYRLAVAQKMADPATFATKAVNETQFINNKANKSKWARGAVGATLMTFKSYSINYLELLHRMATQNGPEGKKAAALMLGMLMLMAGAGGLPFADDLNDAIDFLAQRLGYNFSAKQAKREFLQDLFGQAGAQFVERGITGLPGSPIDVSGRMSMANLIPGTGLLLKKADHTSDLVELAGPVADLAKRTFQAGDKLLDGEFRKAALSIAPKAVSNFAKGVEMADTGTYTDQRGRKVVDVDGVDAFAKMIGFQPHGVAQVQDSVARAQNMIAQNKLRETEIADKWAKGIYEKDQSTISEARAMLKDWNEKNKDTPIKIQMPQIIRRVRDMRLSKEERIAKSAPREIRNTVRTEMAAP